MKPVLVWCDKCKYMHPSPPCGRSEQTDGLAPFALGQADAADGFGCVPEMYYAARWRMDEYRNGYDEAMADRDIPAIYISSGYSSPQEMTR